MAWARRKWKSPYKAPPCSAPANCWDDRICATADHFQIFQSKQEILSKGCISMAEHMPRIHEVLGLIPTTHIHTHMHTQAGNLDSSGFKSGVKDNLNMHRSDWVV
jgi:hypothetical protein